ncbi:hypothetical protein ACAG26_24475 [Mycobacterium sp. pUA109]|uniref:hypothetical protein n=1 Tax=Mycobacterium sp. pUA109 TaxID=3238982 RepID=UPI00351AB43D
MAGRKLALAAWCATALVVLGVACDRVTGGAAVTSAPEPTMSGVELSRLWKNHPLPCANPTGGSTWPDDPYALLETAMWPTDEDVASRLIHATARGGDDFILGRMQFLDAVVLETQTDIADAVNAGTADLRNAAGKPEKQQEITERTRRTITSRHDHYAAAVDHTISELRGGELIADAELDQKFSVERLCHR